MRSKKLFASWHISIIRIKAVVMRKSLKKSTKHIKSCQIRKNAVPTINTDKHFTEMVVAAQDKGMVLEDLISVDFPPKADQPRAGKIFFPIYLEEAEGNSAVEDVSVLIFQ